MGSKHLSRGAILSTGDIRRKLADLGAIQLAASRSAALADRSPRFEGASAVILCGILLSCLVPVLADEDYPVRLVFAACILATAAVALAVWFTRPASWLTVLDRRLAVYFDPIDVEAYESLQRDTSAGGALGLGVVQAWIAQERRALGDPGGVTMSGSEFATPAWPPAESILSTTLISAAKQSRRMANSTSPADGHTSSDSSSCSVNSAAAHCD